MISMYNYSVRLCFSHSEAVLVPANEPVIYICCFQFRWKIFSALVTAIKVYLFIGVKPHVKFILCFWLKKRKFNKLKALVPH